MRRFVLFVLAVTATDGAANTGAVIRVEHAPRRTVSIPGGKFTQGVNEDAIDDVRKQCHEAFPNEVRRPSTQQQFVQTTGCEEYAMELEHMAAREVYLSAFSIDRDEVSVADYRRCVYAGVCALDPLVAGDDRYIRDAWPLVNITWFEAQDYCRWRGGRLPTEAEWERAARGDDGRIFPWGNTPRPGDFNHGQPRNEAMREIDRGRILLNPQGTAMPLHLIGDPDDTDGAAILARPGSYVWGEGPYGTRDQAGNVAEWTADAYVNNDHKKGYDGLPSLNPHRDGSANDPRVVRGGSWRQPMLVARADIRDPYNDVYNANRRFTHIGFRCAYSSAPPASTPAPAPRQNAR